MRVDCRKREHEQSKREMRNFGAKLVGNTLLLGHVADCDSDTTLLPGLFCV